MDLKDSLRQDRARGKVKEPFSPSLFSHVGGLVRRHHLGLDFCRLIESMTAAGAVTLARRCLAEAKPRYEAPLFFLATSAEYLVIQKILAGLDNPFWLLLIARRKFSCLKPCGNGVPALTRNY